MWTVIYIAPSVKIAERIQEQLTDEGFLVKMKQASGSKQQYEILVPESEIDEIQEVLNSFLHL
jgi:ribosomal protein S8